MNEEPEWKTAIKALKAKSYRETKNHKFVTFVSDKCKNVSLGTYSDEQKATEVTLDYRMTRYQDSVAKCEPEVNDGKIYADRYIVYPSGHIYNLSGHRMAEIIGRDGYIHVLVDKRTQDLHRIVAKTFVPNPESLEQVNHIDGNKQNNAIDNLEWVSRSENLKHAYKMGLEKPRCGEEHSNSKLSEEDVRYIRENYKKRDREFGFSALARKYNMDRTTISDAAQGYTWKHIE